MTEPFVTQYLGNPKSDILTLDWENDQFGLNSEGWTVDFNYWTETDAQGVSKFNLEGKLISQQELSLT